jgi:hypothetical protein
MITSGLTFLNFPNRRLDPSCRIEILLNRSAWQSWIVECHKYLLPRSLNYSL